MHNLRGPREDRNESENQPDEVEGLSTIWTVLEGIELKIFTLLFKHYL